MVALALFGLASISVYDVRRYGAVGDGAADDTAAVQAAITACVAGGGGTVLIPRGTYRITSALTVDCGSATVSVAIVGAGKRTTTISQATAGADVLVCGITSAENCDNLRVSDLSLSGGRYALRLNNCLSGSFERLGISAATVGVFMEGQNERHSFRDVAIESFSQNGILVGQLNGGTGLVALDYPLMQKCVFEKIRVNGCTGGTAILVQAGVLGNQQSSGHNVFRKIVLESNRKDGIEIQHSFSTTIEQVSTEENYDTANTYSGIRLGTGAGFVAIRDCNIAGSGVLTAKYGIEVADGVALIERCITGAGGASGTADIFVGGGGATIVDSVVLTSAGLVVSSGQVRNKTLVVNLRDSAGVPIAGSGTTFNGIAAIANGVKVSENLWVTGVLGIGNSAAATTLGSVVKKMEVYDAAGNSLGYLPIYNTIT